MTEGEVATNEYPSHAGSTQHATAQSRSEETVAALRVVFPTTSYDG